MPGTPKSRIYLDSSSSAPLSTRAREAFLAALDEGWADPDRLHAESRQSRALVDGAREAIAAHLGASAENVHFTLSAFTAFDTTLSRLARARRGRQVIARTAVDRVAVIMAAERVGEVTVAAVDSRGHIKEHEWQVAVQDARTSIAVLQHASRETGAVQNVASLAEIAGSAGTPVVVDATASAGHLAIPEGWDAVIAHPADWGGVAGPGVVVLSPHARWLAGPSEPRSWAPGGISVPGILASAVALQERVEERDVVNPRLEKMKKALSSHCASLPGVQVVEVGSHALPHIMTVVIDGIDGEALQAELDRHGVSVGSGSACTTGDYGHSHVLEAMGMPTQGNIRLGLHPGLPDDTPQIFGAALEAALTKLRSS